MTTKPNLHPRASSYDDFFARELAKDNELAIAYLNESLEGEEDLSMFFVALNRILEAQKHKKSALAKKAGISREHLYTVLSAQGNPEWKTLKAILDALGYKLQIAG